ncbi:MAG: hypothetical protein R2795_05320 [Saprospiraceae bacterium]
MTVEDGNWCSSTRTIIVPNGNLSLQATAQGGICGQNGQINLNIGNGSPNYLISWTGPQNGSASTTNPNYVIPNLPAGSYAVQVQDGAGCSDYQAVTVTNSEADGLTFNLIPLPGSCSQLGALWIDIFNGTPIYTVSWSGPQSGILTTSDDGLDIPDLPCGTYTVVITDMNGCSTSHTATITGCDNLDINLTPQNGICGQNGSILVSVSGGTPTYTVSWTGPMNGQTTANSNIVNIPNLPAGTYSVTVTDAAGCSDYAVTQINTSTSNLQVFTTMTGAVCGSEGAIGVFTSGGTAPYQISWSGPESGAFTVNTNSATIPGLAAGSYNIYVVDGNGCSVSTMQQVVNMGSNLHVSLTGNDGVCTQFGNIGVYITNGSGPYQISWSGPISGSATASSAVYQINNAPAGTYTVVVTDANGCATSGTVQVQVQNNLTATLAPTHGVCGSNGSILVNIMQGIPGYNISWSGPVSGNTSTSSNQYVINGLPAGVYTVIITDNAGCTRTLTTTINTTNGNIDIIASLIYNVCGQYNTIWVDVVGGTPPYTITWTGGQNGSVTTNLPEYEIMDLPPGTYKVTVVDANGCMDMQPNIIIYNTPVNLFTVTPNHGECGENGSVQVNINFGTPPFTLTWNGPVSGTQVYNSASINILNNLPGGTYSFVMTDANGCTDTETVVLDTGTPVEIITALIYNECGQYNTIWVDLVGGTPPYTITWQGGQNGTGVTPTPAFEIYDLPPGTYKVTVVDANGCMDMQQDIIVYPAPINLFTATPISGICSGPGSIQINILAGTAPYNLTWTGPSAGTATLNSSSYVIPNLPAGTYTLTLTDVNGCTEVETVTVTTGEDGVILTTSVQNATCLSMAAITAQATGGDGTYVLAWTGPESGSANIGTAPFVINDLMPGTYTLTVDDGNGCDDSDNLTLTEPEDDFTISLTPSAGTCTSAGQIAVNILGGTPPFTVSWSGASSGTSTISGQFIVIPNLPAGSYSVNVVAADGCFDNATTQVAPATGALVLNATPVAGVCGGQGFINLTVTGGSAPYTINWTGAETGATVTNSNNVIIPDLLAGSYTITVLSGTCSATISRVVPAPLPDVNLTATATNAICGMGGAIHLNISNTVGASTVIWSGPQSGNQVINGATYTIPNLPAGTYTVSVMNNGCDDVETVTVGSGNSNINVVVSPQHAVCNSNGSLLVTYTGGVAPYQISWTGPQSGTATTNATSWNIPNLPEGTYTVSVNSGNCTGSATTTVQQNNGNLYFYATPQHGNCYSNPAIILTINSGTPPYTVVWQVWTGRLW